jgi:hypothetical protein
MDVSPHVLCAVLLLIFAQVASGTSDQPPTTVRKHDALPRHADRILLLEDGSLLVAGAGSVGLVRIAPGGQVTAEEHPDVSTILDLARDGSRIWVLGATGLLYREGLAPWRKAPLPARLVRSRIRFWGERTGQLVLLDGGKMAVVRTSVVGEEQEATIVDVIDFSGPRQEFSFPRLGLWPVVADGRGGFWSAIHWTRGPNRLESVGVSHFSENHWTFWLGPGAPEPPPFVESRRPVTAPNYDVSYLTGDGRGG